MALVYDAQPLFPDGQTYDMVLRMAFHKLNLSIRCGQLMFCIVKSVYTSVDFCKFMVYSPASAGRPYVQLLTTTNNSAKAYQ